MISLRKLWYWHSEWVRKTKAFAAPGQSPVFPWIHYWDHAGYLMRRFPLDTRSVLDVGIGSGWLGATVGAVWRVPVDGVEGFQPYVDQASSYYRHILIGDIPTILKAIPTGAYDVVCCLNTIEHFDDPFAVADDLERVARKAVFVSSTNFFMPSNDWDGNSLQLHRSLITAKDYKRRGYSVRGCGVLTESIGRIGRILPTLDSGYLAWMYHQQE